jgi:hypothetical protein
MSELKQWYASGRDTTEPRAPRVEKPHWMRWGIAACRNGTDGLARYLKPVPAAHRDGTAVLCLCGERVEVDGVKECGCGRLFLQDADLVWAARLPA